MKLCAPAVLYLFLAAIGLIVQFSHYANTMNPVWTILVHIVFIGVWTAILNWICSKGYSVVSWVLVILPYAFMALTIFVAAEFIALKDESFNIRSAKGSVKSGLKQARGLV